VKASKHTGIRIADFRLQISDCANRLSRNFFLANLLSRPNILLFLRLLLASANLKSAIFNLKYLDFDIYHFDRIKRLQQRHNLVMVVLLITRFDYQEETIATSQREVRSVEYGVIGLGQLV
jgi:hypothetical protein